MSQDLRQKALHTAANVLRYRNRSRRALLERLAQKDIAEDDALYAVERLAELGFLDDGQYAESLVASYRAKGYGRVRIAHELRGHKLEEDTVEQALADFCPDEQAPYAYVKKQMRGKPLDQKARKKLRDGLFRRGFSWEETDGALRRYTEELEEGFEQ